LVITGGVATASLLVTRVAFSGVILHSGLCYTSDNIDACEEDYSDLLAMFADGLTVPGFAISLGLLGGGLAWMGRWRAYEDLSLRRPLRRRMKLREHLGWGLLGAGLATWAVGMGVGWHCNDVRNAPCFLGVHEGLFYAGAGLTGAGVGLAAFAHGYNRQLRDTKVDAVRVMPTFGRDYAGLSLAGRF
jgi:hypothetical protein